ncbi:MAG: lysine--tRNA ligase [Rickettsiales bacterium]|nr:lysine--tRNA ligase [Rickettsiales bacterium]
MTDSKTLALQAKAWPFAEARNLVKRFKNKAPSKGYALFETGYGPSGLPHLGTFQEVARTCLVMRAFEEMSDIPTKLFCISDDMDGMRKIPENLPQQEMLAEHLHKPLTHVPDPFGTHKSFGDHMNAKLNEFLDHFGFDYEFKSATDLYKDGTYDAMLKRVCQRYDAIMKVMLPSLGEERQATYSPFLPISPSTGRVLYVPMKRVDKENYTITFDDEDGTEHTIPVTGGQCKLQWKPDFGMRWAALEVDFEMYGKDHLVNGKLYSAITHILGGNPPEQFSYELFLDEKGGKISKSKGNGLTIDEWLTYAPRESLAYYLYQSPKKAKRLYFDVIPKAVDEYRTHLAKYQSQDELVKLENPVWHIHAGNPPEVELADVSFALLLNLASVCNPEDKSVLWGFIGQYAEGATPQKYPALDALAGYAVRYYHDFVKPMKSYRAATEKEQNALRYLVELLCAETSPEEGESMSSHYMNKVYTVGREHYGKENMREWFGAMYEVLLGQMQGPRMGSFIALYGKDETLGLIEKALKGEDMAA